MNHELEGSVGVIKIHIQGSPRTVTVGSQKGFGQLRGLESGLQAPCVCGVGGRWPLGGTRLKTSRQGSKDEVVRT